MSTKLQSLHNIGPMTGPADSGPMDPVKKEYEEGKRYLKNGNLGQAAVALHNALIGFEEAKDDFGIANAANQLGKLCLSRKDFDNSLRHFLRTLEICNKNNDRMSIVAVSNSIIEVKRELGDLEGALATALDVFDLQHANRNPQGVVDILEQIAEIYVAMGERVKAADAYRTISSIHKNFKHDNFAAKYLKKAEEVVAAG
jgi:tetratricopeptide (TPR) repeat protein